MLCCWLVVENAYSSQRGHKRIQSYWCHLLLSSVNFIQDQFDWFAYLINVVINILTSSKIENALPILISLKFTLPNLLFSLTSLSKRKYQFLANGVALHRVWHMHWNSPGDSWRLWTWWQERRWRWCRWLPGRRLDHCEHRCSCARRILQWSPVPRSSSPRFLPEKTTQCQRRSRNARGKECIIHVRYTSSFIKNIWICGLIIVYVRNLFSQLSEPAGKPKHVSRENCKQANTVNVNNSLPINLTGKPRY